MGGTCMIYMQCTCTCTVHVHVVHVRRTRGTKAAKIKFCGFASRTMFDVSQSAVPKKVTGKR